MLTVVTVERRLFVTQYTPSLPTSHHITTGRDDEGRVVAALVRGTGGARYHTKKRWRGEGGARGGKGLPGRHAKREVPQHQRQVLDDGVRALHGTVYNNQAAAGRGGDGRGERSF